MLALNNNDAALAWVRSQTGGSGDLNTELKTWLETETGISGGINDLWIKWLEGEGQSSGHLQDRFLKVLEFEGFTPQDALTEDQLTGLFAIVLSRTFTSDLDEGRKVETETFTRATSQWELVDGVRTEYTSGNPAFGDNGWAGHPQRTNNFLNSDAPVTQTTASLGTGTYTAWIEGTGSLTTSAGTAVGSGFGAATEGSPNVFTVSTAGTVVCTIAGSVTFAQVEDGGFPTSHIVTAGATVTRNATVLSYPTTNNLPVNDYVLSMDWTPHAASQGTIYLFTSFPAGTDYVALNYSTDTLFWIKRLADVNYFASDVVAYTAGTTYNIKARLSSTNGVDLWVDGVKGTGNANTSDSVLAADMHLGSIIGTSIQSGQIKNFKIYEGDLSDTQVAAL